ncbi:MAG: leucine-rich repeat domain-containing protein [Treponema sp.]|jgi:hypothetical protein|nr:leucine-rich repeat domain-containing protein [Treponema sp.]
MKNPGLFYRRGWAVMGAALAAALAACPGGGGQGNGAGFEAYEAASLGELSALLAGLPLNTAENPWHIALKGVNLGNLGGAEDGMEPLFRTFQGRYVSLAMDACTGATIGWGSSAAQNTAGRPDKDKLAAVALPAGAVRVGYRAFENARSLKSAVFPPSLRTIGRAAFSGCVSLARAELPETLEHIEDAAFSGCANLETLVLRGQSPPGLGRGPYSPPLPPGEDPGVFSGLPGNFRIMVPPGREAAYKAASGWSFYSSHIGASNR